MEQVYIPQKDYKVLVNCMTYNQSKYIEDALNGFAMQQTDFPFVCLVMDDCSTDGEQDVIKAWMERECNMEKAENIEIEKSFITLVSHRINANCHFAFYFLKENLYRTGGKTPLISPWREHCEYEALCEGDDYWIDNEKLIKQVYFLDSHPDYSMCFHKANVIDFNGNASDLFEHLHDGEYSGEQVLEKWTVPTASVILRIKCLDVPRDKRFIHGDIVLWMSLASKGKLYCLGDTMSVYHRNLGGVTQTNKLYDNFDAWLNHYYAELDHFGNLYEDAIKLRIAKAFANAIVQFNSLPTLFKALFLLVGKPAYWLPVVKEIIKIIKYKFLH